MRDIELVKKECPWLVWSSTIYYRVSKSLQQRSSTRWIQSTKAYTISLRSSSSWIRPYVVCSILLKSAHFSNICLCIILHCKPRTTQETTWEYCKWRTYMRDYCHRLIIFAMYHTSFSCSCSCPSSSSAYTLYILRPSPIRNNFLNLLILFRHTVLYLPTPTQINLVLFDLIELIWLSYLFSLLFRFASFGQYGKFDSWSSLEIFVELWSHCVLTLVEQLGSLGLWACLPREEPASGTPVGIWHLATVQCGGEALTKPCEKQHSFFR
jgi:hypothetical protein